MLNYVNKHLTRYIVIIIYVNHVTILLTIMCVKNGVGHHGVTVRKVIVISVCCVSVVTFECIKVCAFLMIV
jgi:hypothetical protein